MVLAASPKYIDRELERLSPLIEEGGYTPSVDHAVPVDAPFQNYKYYIERLKKVLEMAI